MHPDPRVLLADIDWAASDITHFPHPESSTGLWTAGGSRADFPDGSKPTILRPIGHGVYRSGIGVFDGADYPANEHGPHQIQD